MNRVYEQLKQSEVLQRQAKTEQVKHQILAFAAKQDKITRVASDQEVKSTFQAGSPSYKYEAILSRHKRKNSASQSVTLR